MEAFITALHEHVVTQVSTTYHITITLRQQQQQQE